MSLVRWPPAADADAAAAAAAAAMAAAATLRRRWIRRRRRRRWLAADAAGCRRRKLKAAADTEAAAAAAAASHGWPPRLAAAGRWLERSVADRRSKGAAAASCRMMGLDVQHCVDAMGIAGSHAGGTREYTRSGGTMKRIHCAIPAMSGLRSAMMAAHGITGPRTIIEGDRGILQCYAGEFDAARVTQGLGRDYLMVETAYKPITSPWPAHAPIEAFGWLIDQHHLVPDEIAAIEIGTSRQAMNNVHSIKAARDVMEAQYSLVHGLAVRMFRGGNRLSDYREEDLQDPRFHALSRKVEIKVDPICEEERLRLRNRAAVVTVVTTDGRRLEKRVQYSKGHPKNPLSNDELTAKFMDSVAPQLGSDRAKQIADTVWNIERASDASSLVKLCVKTA